MEVHIMLQLAITMRAKLGITIKTSVMTFELDIKLIYTTERTNYHQKLLDPTTTTSNKCKQQKQRKTLKKILLPKPKSSLLNNNQEHKHTHPISKNSSSKAP